MRQALTGPGILALFDAPWAPIYVIVCFLIHPLLGALSLVGAATLFGLTWWNEVSTKAPLKRANEAASLSYLSQQYSTAGAEVIRALGMRRAMVQRHLQERQTAAGLQLKASFAGSGVTAISRFMRLAFQSLALGAGAYLAIEQKVSAGAIFAASLLVGRALSPIDLIVANWRTLSAAVTSYELVREHLRPEATTPRTELPRPGARLTVRQATIISPARDRPQPLLEAISFEAQAGQVVGVIGPSGAGKTTLLQAIANARVCDGGEVRIDGASFTDWDPDRLGRVIGYMPQDCALFPGSIRDNISRFERWTGVDAEAIDQATIEAAMAAGIHEMILSLPQGYDTVLAPRGRGLSAGQQQRVTLARAVYGAPFLYVLDEPNSNADADAEAALVRLIGGLKARGAIVVMSVHRASLVGVVDLIVQLRGGRLERYGPRDQVLAALQAPAGAPATAAEVR